MSIEIIKQYEQSILELQQVRENRRLTNEILNKIEKDCNEIQKDLNQMSEYVNKYYFKHFKKIYKLTIYCIYV